MKEFGRLAPVAAAHVALERQPDATPPYQAAVRLVMCGSEMHAAARDHTWLAAWRKVMARLREQVDEHRPDRRRAK